jgi:hypothetical protein
MKKMKRNEKVLVIASRIILLSILLIALTIPGILTDSSPNANPKSAAIGFALAILIRLIIFAAYIKTIRNNRDSNVNRRGEYLGLGILLLIFGLIIVDGAVAFLSHEKLLYASVLIFTSAFCDFIASISTIVLFFLKPQE